MLTRQQGTRSSIYLNNPTTEQIQQITDNHDLYAAGLQIQTGTAYDSEDETTAILLSFTMRPNLKRISRLPSAIFVAIIQQIPPQLCFLKMHWKPCKLKRQK